MSLWLMFVCIHVLQDGKYNLDFKNAEADPSMIISGEVCSCVPVCECVRACVCMHIAYPNRFGICGGFNEDLRKSCQAQQV